MVVNFDTCQNGGKMIKVKLSMSIAQYKILIELVEQELERVTQELPKADNKIDHKSLATRRGRLWELWCRMGEPNRD